MSIWIICSWCVIRGRVVRECMRCCGLGWVEQKP